MAKFSPNKLGGEAHPNAWHFSRMDEAGPLPNPTGHTFPLLSHDANAQWRVIGTGFYINDTGFFVTARHVVEDVIRNEEQIASLAILHFRSESGLFGPSECLLRPIQQCLVIQADIALGVAATATNNLSGEVLNNWTWTLSWSLSPVGALVSTYAFPNHIIVEDGHRMLFAPDAYMGQLQASGEYRDSVSLPFPLLQVDMRIHGAASGGPIFSDGHVVGVNCSEYVNIDHPPGPAFGTQSNCLTDGYLDDVVLPGENVPRRVTFDELVSTGCIIVKDYMPKRPAGSMRGRLFRLAYPITAPLPVIEIGVYV